MPSYSIFALGESQLSISGGGQLDGVSQGDGSHMVGLTVTINAGTWQEILLSDGNGRFSDNDTSQRLQSGTPAQSQDFDGVSYADNTIVEAEYGLTLSDGVNTWQVVGFNMRTTSPSYGTVEGLAFIGGPGGFPPVGTPLTVTSAQEGPDFAAASYATPVCYAAGTRIDTPDGPRRVESLVPGDTVWTADHGAQPVLWAGGRHAIATGRFAPIEIPTGVLGAARALRVSPQHRLLIETPQAELLFGAPSVFVTAQHLAEAGFARRLAGGAVRYCHLLLSRHEVIRAEGVASESLFADAGRTGPAAFFGDMPAVAGPAPALARPALRRHEALLLLSRAGAVETAAPLRHIA